MSEEHNGLEESSSQPLPASKFAPLYEPDEFQEYLASDAATARSLEPALPPVWTSYPVPSTLKAPLEAIPPFQRKRASQKNILIIALALLLVACVGGGFLFYALRLYPHSLSTLRAVSSSVPSSPQALFRQVTSRKPKLNDLFNNESTSTWPASPDQSSEGRCLFEADGYHVVDEQNGTYYYCVSQGSFLVNFAFQAQMTILSGDGASLTFRGSLLLKKVYRFRIDQYGYYGLYLSNDPSSNVMPMPLREGLSQNINAGLGKTNVLTVIAIGSDMYLYINSHFIAHVWDNTLSEGQIGLSASNYTKTTEVLFQHAEIWTV